MAYFIDSVAVTEEEFEKRLPEIKLHSKEVNEYVSYRFTETSYFELNLYHKI